MSYRLQHSMEHGELDEESPTLHQSPTIIIHADDEIPEMSESPYRSPIEIRDDNEEALDIKPPPINTSKKDKHKHRHKDDRKKDRDKDRSSRHPERDRGGKHHERREKEKIPKEPIYDDRYAVRERGREWDRDKFRRKEQEEKLEAKRREKSQLERERLEGLERERRKLERETEREIEKRDRVRQAEKLQAKAKRETEREIENMEKRDRVRQEEKLLAKARREQERLMKAERQEREKASRRRKDESTDRHRSHATRHDVERRREKEHWEKKQKSRSRSPLVNRSDGRSRRDYGDHHQRETLMESHADLEMAAEEEEEEEEEERGVERERDHREREREVSRQQEQEEEEVEEGEHSDQVSSSDSSTDSDSDDEDESASNSGSGESISARSGSYVNPAEELEEVSDSHEVLFGKSKFDDDQLEEESPVESFPPSEPEDDTSVDYVEDTPPASPVELVPQLPPYLPAIQGCRNVEEFHCLNRIEEGTYGVVYRARDRKTDEIVALKRLKMEKEKEGFPITSLREINTLLKAQHVNIVTVREIVVGSHMDKIYIVMDYVEHDLKSLMETMKEPFIIGEVKTLLIQLLRGVAHLHDNWIIHRDLKSSNLLLSHNGILKIGDFGLAREYGSPLKQYTPIVVTLWYRAPELLLGIKEYSTHIDMWSVGCIFAEFITKKPLFPGKSEIDELNRIFKELGTPNEKIWNGVGELPVMKKCTFAEYPYNQLRNRFSALLSDNGFDLMNRFLTYDPKRRITAEDGLKHVYFKESPLPVDSSMFPTWPAKSEQVRRSHGNTPKPPSGGKAYAKLLGDDDEALHGFHLGMSNKGAAATGIGFALKF